MMEIRVHDGEEASVRPFLDAEWRSLDPKPWLSGRCVIRAERDGALVGVASGSIDAGVAHLSELMVAAASVRDCSRPSSNGRCNRERTR